MVFPESVCAGQLARELFETSEAWVAQQEATDVERKRVMSLRAELGQVSQELRDSDEECKVRFLAVSAWLTHMLQRSQQCFKDR